MQTFELAPALWSDYFDTVTRERAGSVTLVRAGSRPVADRPGRWRGRQLRAISFDAGRHMIEIDVGELPATRPAVRYYVERPRRVAVSEIGDSRRILITGPHRLFTLVWLEPSQSRPRARAFGQRRCPCAR